MDRSLDVDRVTGARVRDALARQAMGPPWTAGGAARDAERGVASHLHSLYPRLGHMILASYEYHREAVARFLTGGDERFPVPAAAGAVITGAPLPPPGEPLHCRGAAASPRARVVYTAPDAGLADAAAELAAASPGRVSVALANSSDPDAVLRCGPVAEITALGPVSVHVVQVASRWAPGLAPAVIARYAELLPAGSTLCLSLVAGDPGEAGARLMDSASLAGGRGYHHSAGDVARWFTGAGLLLHPDGVQPVRAWRRRWAAGYTVAPEVPGRVLATSALKPA